MTFPQVLVGGHGEARQPGQRRRGGQRAAQVGGDDRIRVQRGEQPGRALGLLLADGVQRDVALALETAFQVPLRLPVPPQQQPGRVAPVARQSDAPFRGQRGSTPPGPETDTGSGSSIRGQSFHSRSSP